MIKFLLFSWVAYMLIKPAVKVYLDNQRRAEDLYIRPASNVDGVDISMLIHESYEKMMKIAKEAGIDMCDDADKDTCPPNDPNCMWRTLTCHWCKKDYKIAKRALTGKYMISDHNKECPEFRKVHPNGV